MDQNENCAIREEPVGKVLQRVAKRFRCLGDENLSQHGITLSQLKVIAWIAGEHREGSVRQRDLEEAFGIRRSSVTQLLQNMEKSGLILRESSSEDARSKDLSLTEKGKELDASLRDFIRRLEEEMLDGFSPAERENLSDYLHRLNRNLEQIERKKV